MEMKCDELELIPVPKISSVKQGNIRTPTCICCTKEEWKDLISVFCMCAKKIQKLDFCEGTGGIEVVYDETLDSEKYVIDVTKKILVFASDYQGAAHGLASVLQLLDEAGNIDKLHIEDWPDKQYRGVMVDLARQWHPFYALLHYVDLCFYFKIKYLHLHFMDDQSYTLPSEVFPELSVPGRHYTKEQIAKLRAYAKARGVTLIPEIEMPGHAKVLNQFYPEWFQDTFDCKEHVTEVTESGAVIDEKSVICVGSEKAFSGILKLIDEVFTLFPEEMYIHLGADEVNYKVWNNCSCCREYMRQNNLKDAKELYADFVKRATEYVLDRGRIPIVWEGFSAEHAHMISKDVVVIGWENYYQTADCLLKNGFRVINSSWKPLYVIGGTSEKACFTFRDIINWNVYEWQHWWDKSEACLNPIHVTPTEQMLGAQLCIWEQTYEQEISRAVENMAAMSERVWSVKRICNMEQFQNKLRTIKMQAFLLIAEC